MKITILIENDGPSRYETEHGLAIHITYNKKNYLLDAGATDAFVQNAKMLGVQLKDVNKAVLSHAHYDHSGGFKAFFKNNKKAKVYLRKEAKRLCYIKTMFGKKYIGIPKGFLNTYEHRLEFISKDCQLDKGVWLIGHKTVGLEERGRKAKMYCETKNGLKPDDFAHEHSLVFETDKGLVIFNSCSHAGMENIVNEVKDKFPGVDVYAVFGGLHLMGMRGAKTLGTSKDEVRSLAETLNYQNIQNIYTGHCTGTPAYKIMSEVLGSKLNHMETGTVIEI